MNSFPGSPRLLKGGIVLIDPDDTSASPRIITLQYNSDMLSRTLAPKSIKESGDRSETLRLTGPALERIKLQAEIRHGRVNETKKLNGGSDATKGRNP